MGKPETKLQAALAGKPDDVTRLGAQISLQSSQLQAELEGLRGHVEKDRAVGLDRALSLAQGLGALGREFGALVVQGEATVLVVPEQKEPHGSFEPALVVEAKAPKPGQGRR